MQEISKESQLYLGDISAENLQIVSATNLTSAEQSVTLPKNVTPDQINLTQINVQSLDVLASLKSFQSGALDRAFKGLEKGEYKEAIKNLDEVSSSVFQILDLKDKRQLIHYRCCLSMIMERTDIESFLFRIFEQDNSIADSDLCKAWLDLIEFKKGSSQFEYVLGMLNIPGTRPSIFEVALRSNHREAIDLAKKILLKKIQGASKEELSTFSGVLYLLAGYCSSVGEFSNALLAINAMDVGGDIDTLQKSTRILALEMQEVTAQNYVASGVHLTIDDYNTIERILQDIEINLSEAYRLDLKNETLELLSLKSLILSLKGMPEEAISTIPENFYRELNHQGVANFCNCYQQTGEWEALISFSEKLSDTQRDYISDAIAIAYLNMEEVDKSLGVPNVSEKYATLIGLVRDKSDSIEMDPNCNFDVYAQYTLKKWQETKSDEYLKSIISYAPTSAVESLNKARVLFFCDKKNEAYDVYSRVFQEIGAGFGDDYYRYLSLLSIKGMRKELDGEFCKFPNELIWMHRPLQNLYLDFIRDTKSARKFLSDLERAIERDNSLWLKTNWICLAYSLDKKESIREKISIWGLQQNGSEEEKARYYRSAGSCVDAKEILPIIYQEFHKAPNSFEYLQAWFAVAMQPMVSGDDKDIFHPSLDKVTDACLVELDRNEKTIEILIDITLEGSFSPWAIGPRDERFDLLIGKNVGEEVELEGEVYKVKAVLDKMIWLHRHAYSELPKQPNKSRIWKTKGETVQDNLKQILEKIDEQEKNSRRAFQEVSDGKGFILTRLNTDSSSAISTWLEYLHSDSERTQLVSIPPSSFELNSRDTEFVLDVTSMVNLGVKTETISLLKKLGIKMVTPPSLADTIRRTNSEEGFVLWQKKFSDEENLIYKNRLHNLSDFIDCDAIKEVDALPLVELDGRLSNTLEIMPSTYKDLIYTAYGHNQRVIVCDDVGLLRVFKLIGIECLTSFQLLTSFASDFPEEKKIVQCFERLSKTALCPDSIPNVILMRLVDQDEEMIIEFLDHHLETLPPSVGNFLSLLIFVAECDLPCLNAKNANLIAETLLKRLIVKETVRDMVRMLIRAASKPLKAGRIPYKSFFHILNRMNVSTSKYIPHNNETTFLLLCDDY